MDIEQQFDIALKRYLDIQVEEKQLAEEKAQLREQIERYLDSVKRDILIVQEKEYDVRISRRQKVTMDYDENILQQRLGTHYNKILSLDLKKVKKYQKELTQILGQSMHHFGSPNREKIRNLIEDGELGRVNIQ